MTIWLLRFEHVVTSLPEAGSGEDTTAGTAEFPEAIRTIRVKLPLITLF